MCGYGKLHVNHTAMLMFGPGLKRMPLTDIPDKNEFLVTLEGGESRCSVTFRRLEGDIFVLEDSTSDIAAAEEVAWWAAVGKAWAAALDRENRSYRRCGEEEAEDLRSREALVLACEWGGELLGYFCVEDKPAGAVKKVKGTEKAKAAEPAKAAKKAKKAKKEEKKRASVTSPAPKPDALSVLGPQAMGLLAPGMAFLPAELEDEQEKEPEKKPPQKLAKKGKA